MVTVYDMATGEQLGCAITEPETQARQDAMAFATELRLQPVIHDHSHAPISHHLPADLATLPVDQFLSKQYS